MNSESERLVDNYWSAIEHYFNKIREGLKEVKRLRERELEAYEHRDLIEWITKIYEVM